MTLYSYLSFFYSPDKKSDGRTYRRTDKSKSNAPLLESGSAKHHDPHNESRFQHQKFIIQSKKINNSIRLHEFANAISGIHDFYFGNSRFLLMKFMIGTSELLKSKTSESEITNF